MKLNSGQLACISTYFRNSDVSTVYVFGSYARGDADELSDLDLIVEWNPISRQRADLQKIRLDLQELLSLRIDIYAPHKILRYARDHIWGERRQIYPEDHT